MIHTPHVDWFAISTILVLLGASFVALLSAVLVPRSARRAVAASVAGLGFVGKFYVFSAAYEHGWTWLVIVGVAATAVSLYYYLAVIRAMYMRPAAELQLRPATHVAGGAPPREGLLQTSVLLALGVTVGSFFAVQPLIDVAKHAASSLPF